MEIVTVALEDVHLDPENVNLHPQRNLDAIAVSLARFGQQKPIVVDETGKIIAGNGTYVAAKHIGLAELKAVRTTLREAEAIAYAIADNKTSELSEWDYEGLASLFRQLQESQDDLLEATGFAPHEIEPLLAANWSPPTLEDLPEREKTEHHTIAFTAEQWEVVLAAIQKVRTVNDDETIGGSRALELISADFLSGAEQASYQ